jgi:hypothetical protein
LGMRKATQRCIPCSAWKDSLSRGKVQVRPLCPCLCTKSQATIEPLPTFSQTLSKICLNVFSLALPENTLSNHSMDSEKGESDHSPTVIQTTAQWTSIRQQRVRNV